MAERLTMREVIEHCDETTELMERVFTCIHDGEEFGQIESKRYLEHKQTAEWLRELQKYKDLKEQDRLVILPDGMNLRKLLDILTDYSPDCPSEYNLVNRCELSCFECWLAALKGAEE